MADKNIYNIENDRLMDCIIERLGERQYKMMKMAEMERSSRRIFEYFGVGGLLVAACVACIVVFVPFRKVVIHEPSNIVQPSLSAYRSGTQFNAEEIEALLEREEYEEAMIRMRSVLDESDKRVASVNNIAPADDEELMYEKERALVENSEIRWMYIYLLLKNDKQEQAIKELEIYIKNKKYALYIDEAKTMLRNLRKKNRPMGYFRIDTCFNQQMV